MGKARNPAVAGTFYPADPRTLGEMVDDFLANANCKEPAPKAVIAPHAGYIYSGPIAASAYTLLTPVREVIRRVVLLGPSHRVPFFGLALTEADSYLTPLGAVAIDKEAMEAISSLSQVVLLEAAHAMEHSLEVHLPFLQTVLTDFTLVPLVVGDASPDDVAEVLNQLWGGKETLIVISSDLSHYQDYSTAGAMDAKTSKLIEELSPTEIIGEQACGCRPVNGLIRAASSRGMHASTLDLRNSGDTAGPRDRVVGYGAYAFV